MNHREVAQNVLTAVGGKDNVLELVHCMTRLRFTLKDDTIPNIDEVKKIKGVVGVVNNGGQFQVVIGGEVTGVYKEVMDLAKLNANSPSKDKGKNEKKGISVVFDTISGIFAPALTPLIAVGLIKSILALLLISGALEKTSQTYSILSAVGDSLFYFFPIILGFSAATKFKANPYLGATLGAVLVHPTMVGLMTSGEAIKFFGMPVRSVSYASSVVPIILSVWAMSYIEKFADKVSPTVVKTFTKPLITLAGTVPIMLVILGPLGGIIGDGLATIMKTLDSTAPFLIPTVIGALSPLLVMTGMHYSLLPITMNNRATLGFDTLLGPGMAVSNVAQGAAGFAVALKTKNKELRQTAISSAITGVLGVTEPVLYGVNLKLKKPLFAVMAGGGLGGLYAGIMGCKSYASGTPGLLSLPGFLNEEYPMNFVHMVIGVAIAAAVAFVLTLILGFEDEVEEETTSEVAEISTNNEIVVSPIEGEVKELSSIEDPTFASGMMGEGIAIEPTVGKVLSPVDGTIEVLFDTKHAIALKSNSGAEILIHVGMDTVELKGQHFTAHAKQGQAVKKGDLIVEFDIESIKKAGYSVTTPVIITNTPNYTNVLPLKQGNIKTQEPLIELEV